MIISLNNKEDLFFTSYFWEMKMYKLLFLFDVKLILTQSIYLSLFYLAPQDLDGTICEN